MAMMITRFHKLIQSKTVWYIFLGVIVITFVGFFTPTMESGARGPRGGPAGELFGKSVSEEQLRSAFNNAYLWQVLSYGQMIPFTQELREELEEEAWVRLASIRKAGEQNVQVSDNEVIRQIQRMPVFSGQDGRFDAGLYQAILRNLGVTPAQIEHLIREQLILSKLMYRYTQAALIPPDELTRAYHLYTDRFVLEYTVLPREAVEGEVTVTREQAEEFFSRNRERFRLPEKVRVSYVGFPVKDFIHETEISEEAALQFYTRNIERFRKPDADEEAAELKYRPFEEVKDEIVTLLQETEARRFAAARAAEFVADVAPRAEGELPDFEAVAASDGLTVKTLPAFGPEEDLQGIDETAPFRQAAFRLRDDPYSSFSDAVPGKDVVYVLSLEQRFPSFIPEFQAVEEKVLEEAMEEAVIEALAGKATEIRNAASESVAGGADFKDALISFGLTAESTPEFSLTTEMDHPYASALIYLSLNASQGEVRGPAAVEEGALIAFVAERKSVDVEVGLPAVRDELVGDLERSRIRRLAAGWTDFLLQEAEFKDRTGSGRSEN